MAWMAAGLVESIVTRVVLYEAPEHNDADLYSHDRPRKTMHQWFNLEGSSAEGALVTLVIRRGFGT
jgi:hypothetical protein